MGRIPLVSTSYLSFVPAGVFLLVVNRKEGALQQRDRDILQGKHQKGNYKKHSVHGIIAQCLSHTQTLIAGLLNLSQFQIISFVAYLKLLVSSLFCSHLHTCRFRHLSNSSEVFTLATDRDTCGMSFFLLPGNWRNVMIWKDKQGDRRWQWLVVDATGSRGFDQSYLKIAVLCSVRLYHCHSHKPFIKKNAGQSFKESGQYICSFLPYRRCRLHRKLTLTLSRLWRP